LLKADTKSIFALARTLTPRMEVPCTRQRVSVLLSYSQAISGGFQCGAHPQLRANHLKCRLSRCVLQIRYACATIATDIRHTPLIRACTKPDKVAGTLQTFRFSLLISNETCAVTLGAHSYRTSKCVKDKGYHTQRQQESEVIPTSTTTCSPLECPCCAPSEREPPDISRHAICLAASKPKKKRRKSKKAKEPLIAAPALDAAPPLAAGVAPRLIHPLSIVCTSTTLTVSLLGVIRSNTI